MRLSRRGFLKDGPALSLASGMAPAEQSGGAGQARNPLLAADFVSASGRDVSSDVIHCGEEEGFSVTPIYQPKNVRGRYQRPAAGNPTLQALEEKITVLEGGEATLSAACGMAAISQTVLTLVSSGDRIVAHRCCYDWVMTLFGEYLPRWGVEVVWVDMTDLDQVRDAVRRNAPKLVWWEPYVNPTMEVLDTPAITRIAKEAGAIAAVDNTWLSPYLYQPLRRGADLVIHSATKYIGGHGNAMGGTVTGQKAIVEKIRRTTGPLGGLMRPFDAFLITQGLKTLPMRMERHCSSAGRVALWLERHPSVARVRCGSLESWPGSRNGTKFVKGYGGMLGVEWKSDRVHEAFPRFLKMCKPWPSLGDVVTLVYTRRAEPRRAIPARYTRISIGLEEPDDIIADFEQALSAVSG
jgi:methionine-gamma-lyase